MSPSSPYGANRAVSSSGVAVDRGRSRRAPQRGRRDALIAERVVGTLIRDRCDRGRIRLLHSRARSDDEPSALAGDAAGGRQRAADRATLGRRYVRYVNTTYRRTGTREGRYRAAPIDGEAYFLGFCRYIELNPVRACMVGHPRDCRWSSYRAHAHDALDALLSVHELDHGSVGATLSVTRSIVTSFARYSTARSSMRRGPAKSPARRSATRVCDRSQSRSADALRQLRGRPRKAKAHRRQSNLP
jgi:hypothetical protein